MSRETEAAGRVTATCDWGFVGFVATFVIVLVVAVSGAGWSFLIRATEVDTLRSQASVHIETAMSACAGPQRIDHTTHTITVAADRGREETAAMLVCLGVSLPDDWLASRNETGLALQVFNPDTQTVGPWSTTMWIFTPTSRPLPALPSWNQDDATAVYMAVAPAMNRLEAHRLAATIPVLFGTLFMTIFAAIIFGWSAIPAAFAKILGVHVVVSGCLFWYGFIASRPVNQLPDHTAGASYLTECLGKQATIDLAARQIVVNPPGSTTTVVQHIQHCQPDTALPAKVEVDGNLPTLVRVNHVDWLVTTPPPDQKDTP